MIHFLRFFVFSFFQDMYIMEKSENIAVLVGGGENMQNVDDMEICNPTEDKVL